MGRKSVGMPAGVEVRGDAIRIRFSWNGQRRSETLTIPATKEGIKTATRLRDQVVGLIKMGLLDDAKYAELFPGSSGSGGGMVSFGEYAQLWLDGREIEKGTRKNYKGALNLYWMPHLALTRLDLISTMLLRKVIGEIEWFSPGVKRNALVRLNTILDAAVAEGLILKNPAALLDVPKRKKSDPDPFTPEEANRIIECLYQTDHWPSSIFAAFFEFAFYTGLRLQEAIALRWNEVNIEKKEMRICRVIALGEIEERTKTKKNRIVLLNDRALHALAFAKDYAERRLKGDGALKKLPYVFPPSKMSEYIRQTSDLHHQWRPALAKLGIRYRPPYNCRHTYATMCLMSNMNPAFIAQQLGHSVQMLLSTYARWLNSSGDWEEMDKLKIGPGLAQAENVQRVTP